MEGTGKVQNKIGARLVTNRPAIGLEIVVVFAPLVSTLIVSDLLGIDAIPLGGGLVLLGGPLAYLSLALGCVALWGASRLRGVGWRAYGLARPRRWGWTPLLAVGVAIALIVLLELLQPLLQLVLPSVGAPDYSRFDVLRGHLPNLILNVVAGWLTTAFVEELFYRGYLVNRIVDLVGTRSAVAWALATVGSALIFALAHTYQGSAGLITTFVAGLLLGGAFLALRRNLWPLVIAHALIDTLSWVMTYLE
jgi:membrane protease YdiL (CAAX protease family)